MVYTVDVGNLLVFMNNLGYSDDDYKIISGEDFVHDVLNKDAFYYEYSAVLIYNMPHLNQYEKKLLCYSYIQKMSNRGMDIVISPAQNHKGGKFDEM